MKRKKIIKGKYSALVPVEEFNDFDFVEIHPIDAHIVVLVAKKGEMPQRQPSLIQKLKRIPYVERTLERAQAELTEEEKAQFNKMIEDGTITIRDGKVYLPSSWYRSRKFEDYQVIEENPEEVMKKYEAELSAGELFGVKHFDGKLYLVRKSFLDKWRDKILDALNEEKSAEDLAAELELDVDAVRALLVVLQYQGEIMEPTKGVYQRA